MYSVDRQQIQIINVLSTHNLCCLNCQNCLKATKPALSCWVDLYTVTLLFSYSSGDVLKMPCHLMKHVSFEWFQKHFFHFGPTSSAGLEPRWQMEAFLQGLDSCRISKTANTDDWVEEVVTMTRNMVFIFSLCPNLSSLMQRPFILHSVFTPCLVLASIHKVILLEFELLVIQRQKNKTFSLTFDLYTSCWNPTNIEICLHIHF